MILRRFRYFATVAEERGISRAASRLFIAQPALTRQIHDLERLVGMPLFERDHRGVQLTSAGRQLREDTALVFARLDETVRRVVLAHEGKVGSLRLGLSRGALISHRVGDTMAAFREQYPEVALLVRELPLGALGQALKADELDAAIGLSDETDPVLSSAVLFEEHVDSALFATSHRLALGGAISPMELANEQLLIDAASLSRFPILRAEIERLGFRWEEIEGLDTVFGYVAAGSGWTLTMSTSDRPPAGLAARRICGLDAPVPMVVRWRKNEALPVVHNFVAVGTNAESITRGRTIVSGDTQTQTIEVSQLTALITALNEGSLSAAAEQLGLTQSTVSRQISSLERALGLPLVSRAGGRLSATAAGTVLRDEAPAILDLVDLAVGRARRAVHGMTGRCAIGTLPRELTNGLLVEALSRLQELYPEVTITVTEGPLQSGLLAGNIDLAIGGHYPGMAEDPSLVSIVLQDDPLECALIAESHPLATRATLCPADLMTEALLFASRPFAPPAYDLIIREMRRLGLATRITAEYNGARTIWRAVASGRGWAIGPRSLLDAPPPGLVARTIEGLSIPWGIGLQWRRDEQNPVVQRVGDMFRARVHQPA